MKHFTFKVILIVSFIIFCMDLQAKAQGSIAFATTDGEITEGVWTCPGNTSPTLKYFYRKSSGTTITISGNMSSAEANYRHGYYFEYDLNESEYFDASLLTSFDISTKGVFLSKYKNTKMKFRFYLDESEEFFDLDSVAGYNEVHSFSPTQKYEGKITKINFWPVYEVYDKNGNVVDNPQMTEKISGINYSRDSMPIEFWFSHTELSDVLPNTEFEYVNSTSTTKEYVGSGIIDGVSKYRVQIAKKKRSAPQVSFQENGDKYSVVIDNPIANAVYLYTLNLSDFVETDADNLPTINADDVIRIKILEDEQYVESDTTIATPFVNLSGVMMLLDGSITFKMFITTMLSSDKYTVFCNGKALEVKTDSSGTYVLCPLTPKELNDMVFDIRIEAYNYSCERRISALSVIESLSGAYPELAELMEALKNYSKSTKAYFFDTEEIIPSTTENDSEILSSDVKYTSFASLNGLKIHSTSLLLEDTITIRHYFTLDKNYNIEDYSFTCNGKSITPVLKQGYYCVDIENVYITEVGDTHRLFVTNSETLDNGYIDYSVASYIARCISDDDDEVTMSMMRNLYSYYLAAVKYAGHKNK